MGSARSSSVGLVTVEYTVAVVGLGHTDELEQEKVTDIRRLVEVAAACSMSRQVVVESSVKVVPSIEQRGQEKADLQQFAVVRVMSDNTPQEEVLQGNHTTAYKIGTNGNSFQQIGLTTRL